MAFTVTELMTDVRRKILMPNTDDLDNDELLVYVNQLNRELYRQAAKYCPQTVWIDDDTGDTVVSQATISAKDSAKVMHWILVRCGDRKLTRSHPRDLYDPASTGQPRRYWESGFTSIRLHPIPDDTYAYSLFYVPEPSRLTAESSLIWPEDFYDLLLDGVSVVAKIRNGWDMRGEAEFMKEWRNEAIARLNSLSYGDTDSAVNGYWDTPETGSDY